MNSVTNNTFSLTKRQLHKMYCHKRAKIFTLLYSN